MKSGDSITISAMNNLTRSDVCELQIAGIVDNIEPYETRDKNGMSVYTSDDYSTSFVLILSRDRLQKEQQYVMDKKVNYYTNIYISTDKPYEIDEAIEGDLKELKNDNYGTPSGTNLYQEREEDEALTNIIKFLLYVFEIIISVFCMMNIFYIISASTIFRTKDFAVLKSIGMSEKQIDKMLILEGFFYGFSGLVFGTVFSFAILKIIGHFTVDAELYLFKLPIVSIVYVVVIVYTVIALAMMSARHRVKNRNIIEDVKNEKM